MPTNNKKRGNGFTLVELMVVISIVAILSSIGLVLYNNVQVSARDVRRKGDINAVAKALEINRNDSGYQPLLGNQFASGSVPSTDPKGNEYCIGSDNNPVISTPGIWSGSCPGPNWVSLTGKPNGSPAYWRLCTIVESPSSVFCLNSTL